MEVGSTVVGRDAGGSPVGKAIDNGWNCFLGLVSDVVLQKAVQETLAKTYQTLVATTNRRKRADGAAAFHRHHR